MTRTNLEVKERIRGVILTSMGLERLEEAKEEAEYKENRGNRFTLEALSERMNLSVDTVMKIFACEVGVDKRTLKLCFSSFDLILEPLDFYKPELPPRTPRVDKRLISEPELPKGQVPLKSDFYIERSPIESNCYKTILQPGSLIRLKAPRRMGKSSLMIRIINHGIKNGCHGVYLNLQLADKDLFQDLDKFLQWFCANVSLALQLPNRVSDYWDTIFGSKMSCKFYFEEYILANLKQPLVLGLDDVDRLFRYPDLADDFFALLRAWHEEGKNRELWQKLRLVVVHSSEVYIPLNMNQSPFNVGLPIELPMLSPEQVQDLAKRYQLNWSLEEVTKLMDLVGGNPYLLRLALYHIYRADVTLDQLLTTSPLSPQHIYQEHLQRQLRYVEQDPRLVEALAKVMLGQEPLKLDVVQSIKLQSLGLINLQGTKITFGCLLYQQYFQQYFQSVNSLTA
ncbi:hypothetical protein AsFPU3_1939 [Aphanothece sacrum FPU3]|nr:hypothetical protein AsFPU3_1939 [Aphanothece sacrum FPU3]